jgi:hypothetical protein
MIPSEAKNADMDATLFYKYAYILITTGSLQWVVPTPDTLQI